jgi:hypothetical protein
MTLAKVGATRTFAKVGAVRDLVGLRIGTRLARCSLVGIWGGTRPQKLSNR